MVRNELRELDIRSLEVEDLVMLSSTLKAFRGEFGALEVDTPEWVDIRIRDITRELASKKQAVRDARVREINAELKKLQTEAEKRKDLQKELAKLGNAQLANKR